MDQRKFAAILYNYSIMANNAKVEKCKKKTPDVSGNFKKFFYQLKNKRRNL